MAKELEQDNRPWICFHCGFESLNYEEAKSHFGDRDDESPICVFWRDLDAEGKLSKHQAVVAELAAERDENARYRSTIEGLEYRLLGFENLVTSRFPKCSTLGQAFNLYDSMEGRALAAEEQVKNLIAVHLPPLAVRHMTFREFQDMNAARSSAVFHVAEAWPLQNWLLAVAGETGEACGYMKKVLNGKMTIEDARPHILKELADIITYADLAVSCLGADTGQVVWDKFEEVSQRVGWLAPEPRCEYGGNHLAKECQCEPYA